MKKNYNENLDKDIKQCLKNVTDKTSVPEGMFFKIRSDIMEKEEKGVFKMKHKILRPRTILIAGVLCVLTTVTCVAAANLSGWYSSSSILTQTKSFPDESKVKEKVGFEPKYVEKFSNGFNFKTFNYSNDEIRDEKGNTIENLKSAVFSYEKDGAQKNQDLTIYIEKIDKKYIDENQFNNAVKSSYKGIEFEYSNYKYKAVDENYEPTDEEKQLCENGSLQIGYGSKTETEDNMQCVAWYEDGMSYLIINTNYDELSQQDMIDMAKEIVDKN